MDPDSRPGPASAGFPDGSPDEDIDIIVEDGAWRRMVPRLEPLVRRAARAAGGTGTVLLTSDAAVRRLNREFRGRDKPTNVLTFDSGDIALAAGVVRREARAAGRPVAHHLAHLVVHGALHLRGLDHGGAGEARRMEMAEARLLAGVFARGSGPGALERLAAQLSAGDRDAEMHRPHARRLAAAMRRLARGD